MPDEISQPLILPHQTEAFERLCAVGRAVIHTNRSDLPIKLRPSVFITGPSGSGKSHLARAVAEALGVPCFSISISEWILISATRRATSTWLQLSQFLASTSAREGCVIFVDELDKLRGRDLNGSGGCEWTTFLLTEIFTLLDLRVPEMISDGEDHDGYLGELTRSQAAKILRTKTLLIGAGAFQEFWATKHPSIGFGSSSSSEMIMPDLNTLAKYVPEELIRRFSSQLLVLRPLREHDYHAMLATIAPQLPDHWRNRFEFMGRARIPEAARQFQGPRFFEELLLEVVVSTRQEMSAPLIATSGSTDEAIVEPG